MRDSARIRLRDNLIIKEGLPPLLSAPCSKDKASKDDSWAKLNDNKNAFTPTNGNCAWTWPLAIVWLLCMAGAI
jgi:hypothetical protein